MPELLSDESRLAPPVQVESDGVAIDLTGGLSGVLVRDFDHDGLDDLLVGATHRFTEGNASHVEPQVYLETYRNVGTRHVPRFRRHGRVPVREGEDWVLVTGVNTVYPDLADLDGDGIEDLVEARYLPSGLFWSRGRGGLLFDEPQRIMGRDGKPVHCTTVNAIQILDLDRDGDVDMVLTERGRSSSKDNETIRWYENVSEGGLPVWSLSSRGIKHTDGKNVQADHLWVADWNLDGHLDLVTSVWGELEWVKGHADSLQVGFGPSRPLIVVDTSLNRRLEGEALIRPHGFLKPVVYDWDHDGLPDLLLGTGHLSRGPFKKLTESQEARNRDLLAELQELLLQSAPQCFETAVPPSHLLPEKERERVRQIRDELEPLRDMKTRVWRAPVWWLRRVE